ncbi:MAG: hypothetical protein WCG98_00770 [bacterium]
MPYYESENDTKQIKKSWREKLLSVLSAKDSVEKIVARYRFFIKGKKALESRCSLIVE